MNENILHKNLIRLAIFILSLTAFTMWFSKVTAQTIFVTDNPYNADFICYVTNNRFEADWSIYMTDNRYDAGDGRWFEVDSRYDADYVVYFTDNKFISNYAIFKTRNRYLTNFNPQ